MSTCPFHNSSQKDRLAEHAMWLKTEGLGPVSRMIRESILKSEIANPDLPAIHSAEAAKFAAMAQRIAPPELLAGAIKNLFNPYPVVSILDESTIQNSFISVIQRTKGISGVNPPNNKFEISDTYKYINLCGNDSCLFLSCFYLSLGMYSVVNILSKNIDSNQIRQDLTDFGRQFNASNLCIALPFAISISLFKLKGENASTDQIDSEVLTAALNSLHHSGQFQISARNPLTDEIVSFKCPMQGYLFNLLTKHRVIEEIIESIRKAENDTTAIDALKTKVTTADKDKLSRKDMLFLMHNHNSDIIMNIAREFADIISH